MTVGMLERIEDSVRIYQSTTGLKDLKLNTKISADDFKRISDEVNLTFLPENKDKFKIEEPVELWLEVKNVQTVHCKVFEFNTLTYYRKTLKPFDTSIDLDGLESTIVRNFEFNHPANCKKRQKFEFPELAGRVGLFIVEFVGNGKSARAVVKKGSLSLIHKSTPAGHWATIIDDARKICKGDKTGIWFDSKFYAAKEDGSIFINYGQSPLSTKVIMVHGDFAQLGEFTRKSEEYSFSSQFYLNEESVVVGSTCSILVTPMLFINGRRTDLSLLQNITAVVKTEDFIENTPTTKTFANLKITSDQDLTIAFQVPPNLKFINVQLTCQVLNTTTKAMKDFEASRRFDIQTFENSTQVHEYHLQMVKDNKYELLVLGKNGEPKPLAPQRLVLQHAYHGDIAAELTTDEHGKIYLGQMDRVLTLTVQGGRKWLLPNLKADHWSFPAGIDTVNGKSIEIPLAHMWYSAKPDVLDRCQVTLTRSKHGIVIEDWFKKIKVVKKQNAQSHYYLLVVDNLEAGDYHLFIRGNADHHIEIKVHAGQDLSNMGNFILKKNCLQELVTSQKIVKINQSQLVDKNTLQVKLADHSKNVRVHIMATNFLPSNIESALNSLKQMQMNQIGSSIFTFAKWTNLLLSDRQLSDEYRYVFDRATAERNLGNSLDRPSLLNKRIFTRKTEVEEERLAGGTKFDAQLEMMMQQQIMPQAMDVGQERFRSITSNRHMTQNIMMQSEEHMMGGGRRAMAKAYNCDNGHRNTRNLSVSDYITDYQNFLRDAPILTLNMKPDQDGNVFFKHEKLSQYSTVQILVVDESSAMQSVRNLQSMTEPLKRDLSLKKSLNENKGLTQSREHKCLEKGQNTFIEDITSSEVMLVDDLVKVNQILTEISQLNGMGSGPEAWVKLGFVKKWDSLKLEQKHFYFGEYQSHELNFFIKKHDPSYFDKVVRSFLESKMEKSFVDLYLLDKDQQIVKTYTQQAFKINLLNAFEKCLLVQVLARSEQRGLAERILKQMRSQVEGETEDSGDRKETFNRIFDLVLNMNSTSKAKPGQIGFSNDQPRSRRLSPQAAQFSAMAMPQRSMMRNRQASYEEEEEQNSYYGQQDMIEDCCDDLAMEKCMDYGNMAQQRVANFNQEKFEQLEATKEYMETFYYNTQAKGGSETTHLVPINHFWCDYAEFLLSGNKTFISHRFTECFSPIEKFLSQTVLDMPAVTQASVHQYKADESRGVTIVAGSSVVIFKKEIKEVEVDIKQDFMVTHRYSRIDQYGMNNKSDDDDAIPKEFLINVPYECEVIMTNVSPIDTEFNLLYQIPIGSMPIKRTKFMKSQPLQLKSYSTERLSFQFYFPQVGQFGHYPSNVSIGEKVTARGTFNTLNVVARRKILQEDAAELNFDDLVQIGTQEQILEYLRTKNILSNEKGFNFQKITWLLQEKQFWTKAIKILRDRQIYQQDVWRLSLLHKDIETIKEYLQKSPEMGGMQFIRCYFESSLFSKTAQDQTGTVFNKMLEYNPMINSRAHKVGKDNQRNILNKTFRQTYDQFLQTIVYKKTLSFEDKMVYVYYLQLQDRIPEAIHIFKELELPEAHNTEHSDLSTLQIQYDYLAAYFDFFTGAEDGYKLARRIVQMYDNYPVSNWKMMFLAIEDQLNDFDGEFDLMPQGDYDSEYTGSEASMKERKQENMKQSKSKEPELSSTQIDEQGTLTIESCNIRSVQVKYYMIDAEILFSRAPFLKDNAEEFSYVKPCLQSTVEMRSKEVSDEEMSQFVSQKVDLPASLKHKNLVIEINGDGKQEFKTFYSSDLRIQINEAFGELKVMHGDKNLGKIYVKVFQMSTAGKESFYRDGYTDIRGKFEYAISSGAGKLNQVKKFSILVQSEEFGSQIREVNPPQDETIAAPVDTASEKQMFGAPQVSSSLMQQKQSRMINRNKWVQSKGGEEE